MISHASLPATAQKRDRPQSRSEENIKNLDWRDLVSRTTPGSREPTQRPVNPPALQSVWMMLQEMFLGRNIRSEILFAPIVWLGSSLKRKNCTKKRKNLGGAAERFLAFSNTPARSEESNSHELLLSGRRRVFAILNPQDAENLMTLEPMRRNTMQDYQEPANHKIMRLNQKHMNHILAQDQSQAGNRLSSNAFEDSTNGWPSPPIRSCMWILI